MTDPHQPIEDACRAYIAANVDQDMRECVLSAMNQVKGNVINIDDVPKNNAVYLFVENIWNGRLDENCNHYHKRKDLFESTGEIQDDFSEFGPAPYDYYELRKEFDLAILKRDADTISKNSTTVDEITLSYYLSECIKNDVPISGINCAVETTVDKLDLEFSDGVTYGEKFPFHKSLDGTEVVIRVMDVHTNNKRSWVPQYNTFETIKKFNADFGQLILTNTINSTLASGKYREPVGDI